ncbi:hypothetical protein [Rhizobium giardinii]|uniref:hypothetical protein n=1 Tax=Rhizobium giardinii TaxID=56731 RepID=UPI003D6DEDD2
MKSGIYIALIAALASNASASAAEITAADCKAISELLRHQAETVLEYSEDRLSVLRAMAGMIDVANPSSAINDQIRELTTMLRSKEMDKGVVVTGLVTFNRVCPR